MPLTIELSTPPTIEPVTLMDLKKYLRIDHADEDSILLGLLAAAREDIERFLKKQIMTATWKLYLDDWPTDNIIRLPKPPLQSVTSIAYVDTNGDPQTLSASVYQMDIKSERGRIMPAYGQVWPTVRGETLNAITITYVAGWSTEALVPKAIKTAIMLMVGDLYEHREAQLEAKVEENKTAMRLLWHHRLLEVA